MRTFVYSGTLETPIDFGRHTVERQSALEAAAIKTDR